MFRPDFKYFHFPFSIISLFRPDFKYFYFHFSIFSLFRLDPGFKYFHFHFSIISLFRPGVFYVNLNPLESQKKFEAVTLTLHEGNPGHNFQFVFNKQQKDLPRFMANPLFTRWAGIFPQTEDYNPFCTGIQRHPVDSQ